MSKLHGPSFVVGTGTLNADYGVTLLVKIDIVGTVRASERAETFLVPIVETSFEHATVGCNESSESMEFSTVHVPIVLFVLNTFRVVNTALSMGVSLDAASSKCATVSRSSESLGERVSSPVTNLNISVGAKENSSTVSVTLRINLTFVSFATRIDNSSSGVLLVDKLNAHDLSSNLRFQLFGVSATTKRFRLK